MAGIQRATGVHAGGGRSGRVADRAKLQEPSPGRDDPVELAW